MPQTMLDAALQYASLGIPVFPCWHISGGRCGCGDPKCASPGKHPLTVHGVKQASTDPEGIRSWFADNGGPVPNIGGAMGNGLVAIDEDTPGALLSLGVDLPNGPAQRTGRGMHLLFRTNGHAIGNRVKFAPGLDTRSTDGYIMLAPSTHELGRPYRWIDGHSLDDLEIPTIPDALAKLTCHRAGGNGKADATDLFGRTVIEELFAQLEGGTGDWRGPMLRIVGSMLMRRTPIDVIVAACRRATWPGYTHEQTDDWVLKCIQDTRKRWDTPDTGNDEDTFTPDGENASSAWPDPDLSILEAHQLPAPQLPLEVFGDYWAGWISEQAEGKSCAPDYVAAGLIAGAGALIGNARWASPWAGWVEPPVLWFAAIGNPSSGKSPGLDAPRDVLTQIEAEANSGRKEELHKWDTATRAAKLHLELWENDVKVAIKKDAVPPPRPDAATAPERPSRRRIITNDATVEKIARIVVENPKGMLLFRDELAGWIGSLDRYGGSGSDRAFYLESYGGRPYAVDRVKDPEPIVVSALTITVLGGIQPDRLSTMVLCGDDDGLAARIIYTWPERVPPRRPTRCPPTGAKTKLSMLCGLEDRCAEAGERTVLMFSAAAAEALQTYREQVAQAETATSGLFLSWLGKLPGAVVRLSNALEHLYWCGDREMGMPPTVITERAAVAAIAFLDGYAMPMARRCFGEAALPQVDRDAIAIARWLMSQSMIPEIVNARELRQRSAPLGRDAARYEAALEELAEAGWVRPMPGRSGPGRKRKDWAINPALRMSS